MSFATLATRNRRLRKLPTNVTMSKGTLEAAVGQSRWVLYRGTTAVVKAILGGVRPIYLESENELSIDSVSGLGNWRRRVTTIDDFRRVIDEEQQVPSGSSKNLQCESDLQSAREYCVSLFTPFDYDVLSRI